MGLQRRRGTQLVKDRHRQAAYQRTGNELAFLAGIAKVRVTVYSELSGLPRGVSAPEDDANQGTAELRQ